MAYKMDDDNAFLHLVKSAIEQKITQIYIRDTGKTYTVKPTETSIYVKNKKITNISEYDVKSMELNLYLEDDVTHVFAFHYIWLNNFTIEGDKVIVWYPAKEKEDPAKEEEAPAKEEEDPAKEEEDPAKEENKECRKKM